MSETTRAARRLAAAVSVLALTSGVAACGSGAAGSPALPGAAPSKNDPLAQILAKAPVAPDSAIPAGTLMAQIKRRGYLRAGDTNNSPLFNLYNPMNGQSTGFDALLAQMLAKYLTGKTDVRKNLADVDTREAFLQNGTVDAVIETYTITPARAQKVDFAGPYYMSGDSILVKKTESGIASVSDLNGKTVATEQGSTALLDLRRMAPGAKIVTFNENTECVQAVEQGRADAYVLDQAILVGDAATSSDVKVVGTPFTQEPYGIGTPKQHPEMKAFVNQWLRTIEQDGLWAAAWKATVGTAVPGNAPALPSIGSVPGS
jgi:glutamate transport system substrate-binding protein